MTRAERREFRKALLVSTGLTLGLLYVALNVWVVFVQWAESTCVPVGFCR